MTDSILNSTKKALDLAPEHTAFDGQIIMHINSAFSTLNQLGVGPEHGFSIEDDVATWTTFLGTDPRFNFVKSYMYLRVRMLFDPPATSFLLTAMNEQIAEYVWRISTLRDTTTYVPESTVLDGGSSVGG